MDFLKRILVIVFILLVFSCGGSKDPLIEEEIELIEDPVAVTLVFPEDNLECQEGVIINDAQSEVIFRWNASENTDSYELYLENIDLNIDSEFESVTNELAITLERGNAYRWYVVSKSQMSEKIAESEIWQFYNAAPATVNYAPFPAEAVSPSNNSRVDAVSGNISLQWEAADIDEDIEYFDIYFGTDNPPTNKIGSASQSEITVDIEANSTYYWYILTIDSTNNNSKSDVFKFSIE
ncbi:hypothetical protein [uncultured Maribacter sp.]|uniref:hypothetical protein n=1 Tax=uncultured Maribacter sp. TaxID=431308 RepID=UPI00260190F9|nr:hypothetical protein [uncultured Maribacter sp.]